MRSLRIFTLALAFPVVLAACGSSGSKTTTSATTTASSPGSTVASGVAVNSGQTSLGAVLVDGQGRTLYHLTKDTATNITCTGACASTWPPLIVPSGQKPTVGPGVTATLTVVMRADGGGQVAANGQPLYTYSGDTKAGDSHGQGVGGVWFAVMANGSSVGAAATPATKSSTNVGGAGSSGSSGGGYSGSGSMGGGY